MTPCVYNTRVAMKGIKGVFGLKDHLDLFKKLEREHASLVANLSDADAAYNFFSTTWHLLEWKYAGRANAPVRDGIRDSRPLLQICEDLAVGAKRLNRKPHATSQLPVLNSAASERLVLAPRVGERHVGRVVQHQTKR
jgi:hypothetical protein